MGLADSLLPAQLDLSQALLLGRSDFTVRSVDASVGRERWNVSYAHVEVLTPSKLSLTTAAGLTVKTAEAGTEVCYMLITKRLGSKSAYALPYVHIC